MYFTFRGISYYVHRWYKDFYNTAYYVYYKDGDLLFIDYDSNSIEETVKKFKKIKKI